MGGIRSDKNQPNWQAMKQDFDRCFESGGRDVWVDKLAELERRMQIGGTPETRALEVLAYQWRARLLNSDRSPAKLGVKCVPDLEIRVDEGNEETKEYFSMVVENLGTGPAINISLRVSTDGKEVCRRTVKELSAGSCVIVRNIGIERSSTNSSRVMASVAYQDLSGDDKKEAQDRVDIGARSTLLEYDSFDNPYRNVLHPLRKGEPFVGESRLRLLEDIEQKIRDGSGGMFCIWGLRRIGKSSLLHRLRRHLESSSYELNGVPVYIECAFLDRREPWTHEEFFSRLATEIRRSAGIDGADMKSFEKQISNLDFTDSIIYLQEVLVQRGESLVLIFDDADIFVERVIGGDERLFPTEELETIENFLDALVRSGKGLSIIFTTGILRDFRDKLKGASPKRVNLLDREDWNSLLTWETIPFCYSPLAEEFMWRLTGGHPSFTQMMCGEITRAWLKEEIKFDTIGVTEVYTVAERMIHNPDLEAYFSYLIDFSAPQNAIDALMMIVDDIDYSELRIPEGLPARVLAEMSENQIIEKKEGKYYLRLGFFALWLRIWRQET